VVGGAGLGVRGGTHLQADEEIGEHGSPVTFEFVGTRPYI
jgi:hypothetical protein